jgi:RNA polymerase sigma-70 factor (ECF subfamily)
VEQESVPDDEADVAEVRARERALARRALEALGERDRQALLLKEEGLDYGEIADVLQIEKGSVGTTLSRARKRLAESYEALVAERRGGSHAAS